MTGLSYQPDSGKKHGIFPAESYAKLMKKEKLWLFHAVALSSVTLNPNEVSA